MLGQTCVGGVAVGFDIVNGLGLTGFGQHRVGGAKTIDAVEQLSIQLFAELTAAGLAAQGVYQAPFVDHCKPVLRIGFCGLNDTCVAN